MNKLQMIKLDTILIVTINDNLDDELIVKIQDEILTKLYKTKVFSVVLDISLLDMIDSFLGRVISDTAKMIKLLGSDTILVGMRPNVAITLVELGLKISSVDTALNIEAGMDKLKKKYKVESFNSIHLFKKEKNNEI